MMAVEEAIDWNPDLSPDDRNRLLRELEARLERGEFTDDSDRAATPSTSWCASPVRRVRCGAWVRPFGPRRRTNAGRRTLEPLEVEQRFVTEARAKGIAFADVVRAYLSQASAPDRPKRFTVDEVDEGLDEAANLIPDGIPPLSDQALSRESIYTREDDWNQ
jgi:hypothetical protein